MTIEYSKTSIWTKVLYSQADIQQHIRDNCTEVSEPTTVRGAAAVWTWFQDTAEEEITEYAIKRLLIRVGLASMGAGMPAALILSAILDTEDAY
jgi:hypothetical protein